VAVEQVVSLTQSRFIETEQPTKLLSIKRRHLIVSDPSVHHGARETLLVHLPLKDLLFNAASSQQSVDVGVMLLAITPHSCHCL